MRTWNGLPLLFVLLCALAGCGVTSESLKPATARAPGALAPEAEQLPDCKTAEVQLTLAENLVREGHVGAAIAYYEMARNNDPRLAARVARRLGVLYDLAGEPARSATEFQTALREWPQDPDLLTDVGYAYYNRGDWAEAEKFLRQALGVDPKNKRARMNLGMTLVQQGRTEEGLTAFGLVVSPAEAHANVAFLLLAQGKKAEARAEYRRALELEPTLQVARLALEKLAT
jgi:Flp pilus assembly protein TadD